MEMRKSSRVQREGRGSRQGGREEVWAKISRGRTSVMKAGSAHCVGSGEEQW